MRRKVILFFLLFGFETQAQNPPKPQIAAKKPSTASRKSVVVDYNSWFETIRIKGPTTYETKALLYGLGASYEYALFHSSWGWASSLGIIQGSAVAGDVSETSSYYARRVPLNIFRFGGRLFQRVNPRFDLGVTTSVLFTLTPWPIDRNFSVEASNGLMIGGFVEGRWRLDRQWELLQSFGTYSRGPSLAWRLGASYSF